MLAVLNPGDEMIIPAPYWVSYPDMAILVGAKPVIISAGIETEFKITPEQLDAAITDKTRLLMLNSPSNPTGVCYTRAELAALGAVLEASPAGAHRLRRHLRAHHVGGRAVCKHRHGLPGLSTRRPWCSTGCPKPTR